MRDSVIIPGNDCIYGTCRVDGCPGQLGLLHPKGHGIQAEEWCYGVARSDWSTALTLTVYTDIYPSTVPSDHSLRCGVRCVRGCGHGDHASTRCTQSVRRPGVGTNGPSVVECGCPPRPLGQLRWGADITLHVRGEPRPGVNKALRMFSRDFTCADCWWSSGLNARRFFDEHGDPAQFKQPESFWFALEAEAQRKHEEWLNRGPEE